MYPQRQPPASSSPPPPVRYWAARGSACVYVDRRRVILGPWGSPKAAARYRALFGVEMPAGADAPPPASTAVTEPTGPTVVVVDTVGALLDAYAHWTAGTVTKDGRPTSTATGIRMAARAVAICGYGATPIWSIGAAWLTSLQAALCTHPDLDLARGTINAYTGTVRQAAKWGASRGFLDASAAAELALVGPLRRGRSPAPGVKPPRDSSGVTAPPRSWIRRVQRHLPPHPRVMLALQLLTGMRPGEVCAMRPIDLVRDDRTGVLIYTVPGAKTDHLEHDHDDQVRRVYLGPRAEALLRMVWPSDADGDAAHFFRPAESARLSREARRAARRTPMYPSHTPGARAQRRALAGLPERAPRGDGAAYTPDSYRRAIERAIERVRDLETARGVPERDRVGAFTPYQLRHLRATIMTERLGLHAAQHLLGHRDIKTTTRYAHARRDFLTRHAARLG